MSDAQRAVLYQKLRAGEWETSKLLDSLLTPANLERLLVVLESRPQRSHVAFATAAQEFRTLKTTAMPNGKAGWPLEKATEIMNKTQTAYTQDLERLQTWVQRLSPDSDLSQSPPQQWLPHVVCRLAGVPAQDGEPWPGTLQARLEARDGLVNEQVQSLLYMLQQGQLEFMATVIKTWCNHVITSLGKGYPDGLKALEEEIWRDQGWGMLVYAQEDDIPPPDDEVDSDFGGEPEIDEAD
ncbi:hypothetical protein HIM_07481 [Hirsutella minnesotensis 3608]|uniref:Uncharacterized protein n=1 Tax=Hirsutella minnesotensis 3608 TaxID=1043627 RepID=A0A0F7ZYU8_9HYPO|nr:hypothetical protein HIM_07481 [Hirsutella minnesotensis 3608]